MASHDPNSFDTGAFDANSFDLESDGTVSFSAAIAGSGVVGAFLSQQVNLGASITGSVSVSATLSVAGAVYLSAAITGSSTVSANLGQTANLSAAVTATASVGAVLSVSGSADVKVSWLAFDSNATPVDVKVSWLAFDTQAVPCDVRVSWVCFDSASSVGTSVKSGVNRQWLIDYYTKEFAKETPLPATPVKKPKRKRTPTPLVEAEVVAKVERAVAKAEKDLQQVVAQVKDTKDAEQFVQSLLIQVQLLNVTVFDFQKLARTRQEDEDLLMFAMGMLQDRPAPLGNDSDDLLLLAEMI